MAYFDQNEQNTEETRAYTPVFQDTIDFDEDPEALLDDPEPDPEETEARRKDRIMLLVGAGNFVSIVVGTVVILLLASLLFSLLRWVSDDISQTFTLWQTRL